MTISAHNNDIVNCQKSKRASVTLQTLVQEASVDLQSRCNWAWNSWKSVKHCLYWFVWFSCSKNTPPSGSHRIWAKGGKEINSVYTSLQLAQLGRSYHRSSYQHTIKPTAKKKRHYRHGNENTVRYRPCKNSHFEEYKYLHDQIGEALERRSSCNYSNERLWVIYSKCDKMLIFKTLPRARSTRHWRRGSGRTSSRHRTGKKSGIFVQSEEDRLFILEYWFIGLSQ